MANTLELERAVTFAALSRESPGTLQKLLNSIQNAYEGYEPDEESDFLKTLNQLTGGDSNGDRQGQPVVGATESGNQD